MIFSPKLRPRRCDAAGRNAFTLLEVILAVAILGGALAVLGEVMHLAGRGAQDARAETQAQLLANSLMDELLAGVDGVAEATRQPLEVDDVTPWLYTIAIGTSDIAGANPVEVTVEQDLDEQFNPVKFRLVRWLPVTATKKGSKSEAGSRQSGGQNSGSEASGGTSGAGGAGA